MHDIEPSRAPSEDATEAGEELRQRLDLILVSIALRTDLGAQERERLIIETKRREHALAMDAFAAQRLTAALLDPSEAVVEYGRACLTGHLFAAGWAEVEFRKIPPEALQTAFGAAMRVSAMKITGRTE